MRRDDPRLAILRETLQRLIPGATPAFLTVTVTETLARPVNPDGTPHRNEWAGRPEDLAERLFTALYGRPRLAAAQAWESGLLDVITGALTEPQIVGPEVTHDTDEPVVHLHAAPRQGGWMTTLRQLAAAVHAAVLGSVVEDSPLTQAEDAHTRRDIGAMVDVLTHADHQLTHAPWYPARPGDLVHVHYEAGGQAPAFGETYIVGDAREPGDADPGLLSMVLLAHTLTEETPEDDVKAWTGVYEVEAHDDPIYEPWFEAGPQRLTVVRDGRVVHNGGAR
ncbi:hypothetical protein [Streptomyces ossamyceticus]|uniref:hypothetical protein n=1 Tax=Streptomyces ossamyceticus TaxID=249581 RepID=UPI00341AB5EB